jgi:hypothetical protein
VSSFNPTGASYPRPKVLSATLGALSTDGGKWDALVWPVDDSDGASGDGDGAGGEAFIEAIGPGAVARRSAPSGRSSLHTPADFKGNDGDDKENQLGLLITASAQSAKRKREENNTTAAPTLIGYACDAVRTLIYWPSHSFAPRLLLHS